MNEIYWITRLDGISTFFSIILFISAVTSLIFIVVFICSFVNGDLDAEDKRAFKALFKILPPIVLISTIAVIFIPTTKDMYEIYGIGTTLDYLKSNPEVKQLPDKYIKVLNKVADEELKSDSTKTDN